MCSPTSGTASMRASKPPCVAGGSSAGSVPLGEPISRQRSRALNCSWFHTSAGELMRALAMPAASSFSTNCSVVMVENTLSMIARISPRRSLRLELLS